MERQTGFGLLLVLFLAACGAGGASPVADAEIVAAPQAVFAIRTETLPSGSVGAAYPLTTLVLDAEHPQSATWTVQRGALPDGLTLLSDGGILGTPSLAGVWVFTARAQASDRVALKRLAIAVDAFGVFAQEGLTAGRAWAGSPVRLRAVGAIGDVAFAASGSSGGSFQGVDPLGGTATYLPGMTDGEDEISVADERGALATLSLDVTANPLADRVAAFGTSDVWHVDVHRKFGTHSFATDLHDALASVGLRSPVSHASVGTEADNLAELWVRLAMHRLLNEYYGREPSGGQGAHGLPICFAWDHPAAPHTTPVPGGRSEGAPHRFIIMALVHSGTDPLAGRALVDDPANSRHEHNAPSGGE